MGLAVSTLSGPGRTVPVLVFQCWDIISAPPRPDRFSQLLTMPLLTPETALLSSSSPIVLNDLIGSCVVEARGRASMLLETDPGQPDRMPAIK